jgi:hypothetical protein
MHDMMMMVYWTTKIERFIIIAIILLLYHARRIIVLYASYCYRMLLFVVVYIRIPFDCNSNNTTSFNAFTYKYITPSVCI